MVTWPMWSILCVCCTMGSYAATVTVYGLYLCYADAELRFWLARALTVDAAPPPAPPVPVLGRLQPALQPTGSRRHPPMPHERPLATPARVVVPIADQPTRIRRGPARLPPAPSWQAGVYDEEDIGGSHTYGNHR